MTRKVVIIVGSLRAGSINLKLAKLHGHLRELGREIS